MRFEQTYVGAWWSSPFARWQGSLAEMSSIDLAVDVTSRALAWRGIEPSEITDIVFGQTVPQKGSFYASTTLASLVGAKDVTGPTVSQACATAALGLQTAGAVVEGGPGHLSLLVTADRTSNGPVVTYPSPGSMGGAPVVETWVLDNFASDPASGMSPTMMAEAVARDAGASREALDDITVMRAEQYESALADDRAFQRRFMVPVELPSRHGATKLEHDEGVRPVTREGLQGLEPLHEDGVITYGNQTHPADASAGMVLVGSERARELARGDGVARLVATGFARVAPGEMPKAPVPAAHRALQDAGLQISDIDVVTCHTPFAVNDLWFANELGYPLERMSPRGCSLVYGHPQAPVGARSIAELIEILRERGGGTGLFTGCAAGDTGGAAVIEVTG